MISKLVISFTIILVVGHYTGTDCAEIDNGHVIQQHKNYINYDLFKFPEFKIESFGLYNRQCFLASMMYLTKGLFASTHDHVKKANVEMIMDIILRIFRSSAGQTFLIHLDAMNNMVPMFNKIRYWLVTFNILHAKEMQNQATHLINVGLLNGVWYTDKELTLLDAYRNSESKLINTAVQQCKSTMQFLALPSLQVEDHLEDLFKIDTNYLPDIHARSMAINQGIVIFLMTPDEYKNTFHTTTKSKEEQYYEVLGIVQSAVENIFDGILNVLYSRNIFACDFLGTVELPLRPKIQIELLLLLQDIFPSVVEIAQEIFLLQQTKLSQANSQDNFNFNTYMNFSRKFKYKWTKILDQDGNTVSQTNDAQTLTPDTPVNTFNKIDPDNEYPLQSNGRLIKNGVVSPSLMLFYGVFNKSWDDDIQNETNTNHNKIFLFELKAWIVLMKHSLQFMPTELQEKRREIKPEHLNNVDIWQQLNADSTFMDNFNSHST
ncbi:Hypothetical protein CINCED_3A024511 [Cinara cedri]|uniref:Uncharacterized protein n=1 Tax=Cinara cedri TaxID=506608 RepID=A0A5E4LZI2_9HEMI|nr:Hypothetical protein CINCED_3A024511 [Cinara cedri]